MNQVSEAAIILILMTAVLFQPELCDSQDLTTTQAAVTMDTTTEMPTDNPSLEPTAEPTTEPTAVPTGNPTFGPTIMPSFMPTEPPTDSSDSDDSSDSGDRRRLANHAENYQASIAMLVGLFFTTFMA